MATGPVVHPQPVRGDPVDLKNAAAKNRRALGDIGNVDSLIGVEGGKINRPITRNFRAQLLENAQVAAAANKKAPILDGVTKKQEVVRAVQKKARGDKREPSKPIEVIVISPDTNEVAKAKENKKKVTYSSVLDARSKNESKPQMYMHTQPEIDEKMRSILIDWLVEVHVKFDLSPETLYLTVNIIDRFLSLKTVPRRELQLVGVSALLIASKYEEIWPPQVNDLVYVTDNSYNSRQILVMEKTILGNLEWYLTVPTQYVFLVRFIKASGSDQKLENLVHFLAELGLMHHDSLMFCPSMLAASAVYTARCCLNKTPTWTDTLKFHTGYSESQLMDCSKLLAFIHSKAGESKLRGVLKKYSKLGRGAVALISPAKSLMSSAP
ncbi:Cyclin-like superfamily [Arabidopsis thaliana x Arabidopsis arenosa]|uniref:Cyclin-like superfamily n=1 Tax=Arabidopsis thaliana x Arabidopsis arenosa TaxID=1240361 RepID=A0A8T2ELI5_9BRAS|nr:Cyclin-like superfamily [Arabidopsis thaliana x Arabidopsis arenosa]